MREGSLEAPTRHVIDWNNPDFIDAEKQCQELVTGKKLALPAYDQCIKASHAFNLLDARGVISVTERAAYIARVRALAKACCEAWLETPMGKYKPRYSKEGG